MDELDARARSLLDAASLGDDPTAEDAHRVRHAVLLRVGAIGVGTAALATSTAQAKGILSTLAAKVGATLVVVAGGTATVTYYSTQPETKPVAAVASPAPAPKAAARAPRAESAPALKVEELPLESEAPKRQRAAARAAEPEPTKPEQYLEAEMQLIRAADAALRGGRTSEALSLLGQHAERHPRGLLAHEREGLNLLARCQSGGRAAAQAAAELYVERAPRSPLTPRLRSACGLER
jgi:hypothetical protein